MIIKIPTLRNETIHTFIEELYAYVDELDDVSISFESCTYSFPYPMLIVGSAIRRFVRIRRNNGLETRVIEIKDHINAHSYLKHLGFFNFLGSSTIGKKIGQASGSSRYIPIRQLNKTFLESQTQPPYLLLRHVIDQEAKKIAKLIIHEECEEQFIVSYSIREIIRNVFEHSESDYCFICGQRWYDGSVELCILDEGVGIKHSLSSKYDFTCDLSALEEAIQPGISSKDINSPTNVHDNSGFGLYVLSELGKELGWFSLGSGSARLFINKIDKRSDNLFHKGTYVGLHLSSFPKNFKEILDSIIHNGETEAYIMGRESKASASTKIYL